eukprot:g3038.t1
MHIILAPIPFVSILLILLVFLGFGVAAGLVFQLFLQSFHVSDKPPLLMFLRRVCVRVEILIVAYLLNLLFVVVGDNHQEISDPSWLHFLVSCISGLGNVTRFHVGLLLREYVLAAKQTISPDEPHSCLLSERWVVPDVLWYTGCTIGCGYSLKAWPEFLASAYLKCSMVIYTVLLWCYHKAVDRRLAAVASPMNQMEKSAKDSEAASANWMFKIKDDIRKMEDRLRHLRFYKNVWTAVVVPYFIMMLMTLPGILHDEAFFELWNLSLWLRRTPPLLLFCFGWVILMSHYLSRSRVATRMQLLLAMAELQKVHARPQPNELSDNIYGRQQNEKLQRAAHSKEPTRRKTLNSQQEEKQPAKSSVTARLQSKPRAEEPGSNNPSRNEEQPEELKEQEQQLFRADVGMAEVPSERPLERIAEAAKGIFERTDEFESAELVELWRTASYPAEFQNEIEVEFHENAALKTPRNTENNAPFPELEHGNISLNCLESKSCGLLPQMQKKQYSKIEFGNGEAPTLSPKSSAKLSFSFLSFINPHSKVVASRIHDHESIYNTQRQNTRDVVSVALSHESALSPISDHESIYNTPRQSTRDVASVALSHESALSRIPDHESIYNTPRQNTRDVASVALSHECALLSHNSAHETCIVGEAPVSYKE